MNSNNDGNANDNVGSCGVSSNGNGGSSGSIGSTSSGSSSSNNNNNNNNYVNFNQFIIQHNLSGGAGFNSFHPPANAPNQFASAFNFANTNFNNGPPPPAGVLHNLNAAAHFGQIFGAANSGVAYEKAAGSAATVTAVEPIIVAPPPGSVANPGAAAPGESYHQAPNCFNPHSDLFPTSMMYQANGMNDNGGGGADGSDPMNGGCEEHMLAGLDGTTAYNNTTSQNLYDNFYTPFGNNGTTYYANPFATGFDFNAMAAAVTASALHATAPEFVPRFVGLSLSESEQPLPPQQQQQRRRAIGNGENGVIDGVSAPTPLPLQPLKAPIATTITTTTPMSLSKMPGVLITAGRSESTTTTTATSPAFEFVDLTSKEAFKQATMTSATAAAADLYRNEEAAATTNMATSEEALSLKDAQRSNSTSMPRSMPVVLKNVESISSNSSSSSSPTINFSRSTPAMANRTGNGAPSGGGIMVAAPPPGRGMRFITANNGGGNSNNGGSTTTNGFHSDKSAASGAGSSSVWDASLARQAPPTPSTGLHAHNQGQSQGPGQGQGQGPMQSFNHTQQQQHQQTNGRRSVEFHDRDDYRERADRSDRGGLGHHRKQRDREYHHQQRYENHRNKRWDDHNRNRDRLNGFRDTLNTDLDGKESPLPSPEKKPSPKKIYPENEKLSQREKLIRDIEIRRLECLVCVEPIKAHHSVWSCQNCYHILHLQCIIKWASSSKSDDGWRCPACQNVLKEVPRTYYCFCGKMKNPSYNRQDIAHSCGEVCSRVEGCTHACTLLCHPGPCPPCQANVKRECGCGKTTRTMQCCLKEPFVCDDRCGKWLNCEAHSCAANCHEGRCEPCGEKVEQRCHCLKQERQVICTRESHDKHTYSCGKPCGKDLSCGNHKCKDCCHAGECRPCKLSPEMVTSCPCGKMPVVAGQRGSCLDAIPVCQGICSKTLRCGKAAHPHHCTSKCHLGNCPPCNKQTAVKCRCGHMDQMIKCRQLSSRSDDARCKKRCVKKRSCGKHKCNQECCIDIDHICPLPCNYTLSCGKHKCDQPCHRGNCPPCYRSSFEELFCECGSEVIYPPVPCGTKRPICKRPCSRQHPCEHPPQHNCHSAAACPPCMMFTTKSCYGQHEQRKTIPCSQESFSCGLACNKPLPCGRHKCIKTCHEQACQAPGEVCRQSCTVLRAGCGHKCMTACHQGDCPDTPCKEVVEVQCECGNRKQTRSCADLSREYSRIATAQLASSMAEVQRGNYMELSEILAPVKNKTNKTLDCNEECRLLERNRRLAIGLQIRNPDVPQKLLTKYSDFIRNYAKRDAALVKSIHDSLSNLVKLAKESKQKSRSHSFPTMNREKRQLVHEMCEMFGVDSVAYDSEPNRNVVATAYKDRSWLPATSIMEVMQRESGQRRVPVPSNNAWGLKR